MLASSNERIAMAALGALQGFAFWLISDNWPEDTESAALFFAAATFIAVSGLVLHMARSGSDRPRLVAAAFAVGAAFAVVGWRVAALAAPEGAPYDGDDVRYRSFAVCGAASLFILGPYLQIWQRSGRLRFPYEELHRFGWNNAFIAGLAGAYTLLFWLVLWLWGSIFALVDITFFRELFAKDWFAFVFSGAAIGFGLATARESEGILATLRSLLSALLRTMLPVLSAVTLAFVATLAVTGLERLFATQMTAWLLSFWTILFLVMLNAVFEDGRQPPPYPRPLRLLVEAGIFVLPVLAAIAGRAVQIRIGEYGLVPERIFAAVGIALLGLYTLGYALAVMLRGEPWLPRLRTVNVAMCAVVIASAVALHLPAFDPVNVSLANQLERLRSGAVSVDKFDFKALRFTFGRAGYEALAALEKDDAPGDAEVRRKRISHVRAAANAWELPDEDWPTAESISALDPARSIPAPLLDEIRAPGHHSMQTSCTDESPCRVAFLDLDDDGREEALVVEERNCNLGMEVYASDAQGAWTQRGRMTSNLGNCTDAQWKDLLEAGALRAKRQAYPDVEVGDRIFHWWPQERPRVSRESGPVD